MFNKRRKLQLPKTDRPTLHQVGETNVFVLGEPPRGAGHQIDALEQMVNDRFREGKTSLKPTQARGEGKERRNPLRRIKIDSILQTSTIPPASKKTIITLLKIINRSLRTSAEKDVALKAIKTFLGE